MVRIFLLAVLFWSGTCLATTANLTISPDKGKDRDFKYDLGQLPKEFGIDGAKTKCRLEMFKGKMNLTCTPATTEGYAYTTGVECDTKKFTTLTVFEGDRANPKSQRHWILMIDCN